MKRIQGALRNRGLLYFYMSTSKVFLNYTDWHDVDEDLRTTTYQGGAWNNESRAGIARDPYYSPTTTWVGVASYV